MTLSELPSDLQGLNYYYEIAEGSGTDLELDKGGYWSPGDRIWVDRQLKTQLEKLPLQERVFVELMANAGKVVGKIFEQQLNDSDDYKIWPKEVFGENGADKLIEASRENITIIDPYANLSDGLDRPAIPYSHAYGNDLTVFKSILRKAQTENNSRSSLNHHNYFLALQAAFDQDTARRSDLAEMRVADKAWVDIDPVSSLLVLAEPAEVYYDPARIALAQLPSVAKWVDTVTDFIGLPPWKTFFEFRVLVKDESMISKEEIEAIRSKSRELYKLDEETEVPVSTEFRRLLLASGNGAHPAKIAKNYPNFEDIKDRIGYKNILYSNMIIEGVKTSIIPAFNLAFGRNILEEFTEDELIRGRVLGILCHEENHPFRRFRDTPIEELKSSVNGLHAVIESGRFSGRDIQAMILTEIGSKLFLKHQISKAKSQSDFSTLSSLEAYSRANTIFLNYLKQDGVFLVEEETRNIQINFDGFISSIGKFAQILEEVRIGDISETIPGFYTEYESESIWDIFKLLPVDFN